jgi:hypothetical protein
MPVTIRFLLRLGLFRKTRHFQPMLTMRELA